MRSSSEINNLVKKFNEDGRSKTFAEFIAELFKDKFIEIYLGDMFEEVSTEQVSTAYAAVFCGKVISAYRECLVMNSFHHNTNGEMILGNVVFISERSIKTLREIDGHGTINDLFIKSGKNSLELKKTFVDKKYDK